MLKRGEVIMVSEEKVKQIISSVKDSGVYTFDDNQFKDLLTLLNKLELQLFKELLIQNQETEILSKYEAIEEEVVGRIDQKLDELDGSELITLFKGALLTNKYIDYLSALQVVDLQSIRFYISNKVNVDNKDNLNGSIKLVRIISKLLREKETHKLNFDQL
jgi:hypothetical protein